ncbi:MAG TPA: hypothetical protein DD490_21975 [Acidobacteria bacterium]|nr:hypothetical protein [Acidobacteriota bacterium]
MTILLNLSAEQENRLRAGAAQQDTHAIREVLLQAVESTVETLLRQTSAQQPKAAALSAQLAEIASGFRHAPALSDEAVSRTGIYADHP